MKESDSSAGSAEAGEQWARRKSGTRGLLLRRRQAEFENYRRRMERERMEFAEYASMESVRGAASDSR